MRPLLRTGARVTSVHEEGEVTLFCYSLQRRFTFDVSPSDAKRWGELVGSPVTVQVLDEAFEESLYECATCSAKPGMATLCRDCLERRKVAGSAWRGQLPADPTPTVTPSPCDAGACADCEGMTREALCSRIDDLRAEVVKLCRALERIADDTEGDVDTWAVARDVLGRKT